MMPLTPLSVGLVSVSAALKNWTDNPEKVAIKTFSKSAREALQSYVTSKPQPNLLLSQLVYCCTAESRPTMDWRVSFIVAPALAELKLF